MSLIKKSMSENEFSSKIGETSLNRANFLFGGNGGGRTQIDNVKYVYSIHAQYDEWNPAQSKVINWLKIGYVYGDEKNRPQKKVVEFGKKRKNLGYENMRFRENDYCKKIILSKVEDKNGIKDPRTDEPGEFIRSIYIEKPCGSKFSVGLSESDDKNEKIETIEFQGILKNIIVSSGDVIDSLEVIVDEYPNVIETFDYTYDEKKINKKLDNIIIYSQEFNNMSETTEMPVVFEGSRTLQHTISWHFDTKLGFSYKATAKAGVPFMGKGEVEIGATIDIDFGWSGTKTEEHAYRWQGQFTLAPKRKIKANVIDRYGKLDLPYKCNAILHYRSGAIKTGYMEGIFENASMHDLYVELIDNDKLNKDIKEDIVFFMPPPAKLHI
jgi:hypothetical protein